MTNAELKNRINTLSYISLITLGGAIEAMFRPGRLSLVKSGNVNPVLMFWIHTTLALLNLVFFFRASKKTTIPRYDISQEWPYFKMFYIVNFLIVAFYMGLIATFASATVKIALVEYIIPASGFYVSWKLWKYSKIIIKK